MEAAPIYFTFIGFLAVFIFVLILIGIFLTIRGVQRHFFNLIIAGIGFLSLSIGFLGNFIFNLGEIFQEICVFICLNATVVFTNLTFYKGQKKGKNLILILTILLGLIQILLFLIILLGNINVYYLRVSLDVPYNMIPFLWMSYASFSAYKQLRSEDIQPWIKVRYKLIAIFSLIISFNNIPEFFQPKGIQWGNPANPISLAVFGIMAVLALLFSIGFGLAWLMPKWFKLYLNKDYKEFQDIELSEDELMKNIQNQLKSHFD